MELIWTEQAKKDYFANIDFLMSEWSLQVAEAFVNQVKKTLRSLLIFPEMYPQSSYKNLRKALVTKQVNLYYLIEGETIYLIRFKNNYQNPS